ncbi:MAG: serine/threonine-protein kinase [Acidobacteriota bacterium]
MAEDRYERVKSLFLEAVELEPDEQAAFLREASGGDDALLSEVRQLLDAYAESSDIVATRTASLDREEYELGADSQLLELLESWGRYEDIELIGRGGMGVVFRARDTRLRRTVALKFLRLAAIDQLDRFRREAEAQARIDHEHVLPLFEAGERDGRLFIAMRHVQGPSLLGVRDSTTLREQVLLMLQVARGLGAAHQRGLVHRDVKPGNILVERRPDGRLWPYIADFGLAARTDGPRLTATGLLVGSPSYMAPERLGDSDATVDARSDLYSLGTSFFELIAGRLPHEASNSLEALVKLKTEKPAPLRRTRPEVPRGLEKVFSKLLARDPAGRPTSATELVVELEKLLDTELAAGRPAAALRARDSQPRRWAGFLESRWPRVAAAAAVLAFGLFVASQWPRREATVADDRRAGAIPEHSVPPHRVAILSLQARGEETDAPDPLPEIIALQLERYWLREGIVLPKPEKAPDAPKFSLVPEIESSLRLADAELVLIMVPEVSDPRRKTLRVGLYDDTSGIPMASELFRIRGPLETADRILGWLQVRLGLSPIDRPLGDQPLAEARALLRHGHVFEAKGRLDRAEARSGSDPAFQHARGEIAVAQGELDVARHAFVMAAELSRDAVHQRVRAVHAMEVLGDHDSAARFWHELVDQQPRVVSHRLGLVEALLNAGRLKEAQEVLVEIRIRDAWSGDPRVAATRSRVLEASGDLDSARVQAQRSIDLARRLGSTLLRARGHVRLAEVNAAAGFWARASEHWTRARCLFEQVGDSVSQQHCLLQEARVASHLGQLEYAWKMAGEARQLARTEHLLGSELEALLLGAHLLRARGELDDSSSWAEAAVSLSRTNGRPVSRGDALREQALTFEELGDFRRARDLHEQASFAYNAASHEPGIAAQAGHLARLRFVIDADTEAARRRNQLAITWLNDRADDRVVARLLDDHGELEARAGQLAEAWRSHEEARAHRRRRGDLEGQARSHLLSARLAISKASLGEAREHLSEALRLAEQRGEVLVAAAAHRELGLLHALEGDPGRARWELELALEQQEPRGARAEAARTRSALAWLDLEEGFHVEAETTAREAATVLREAGDVTTEALARTTLGLALLGQGRNSEADEVLHRAQVLAMNGGDRAVRSRVLALVARSRAFLGHVEVEDALRMIIDLADDLEEVQLVVDALRVDLVAGTLEPPNDDDHRLLNVAERASGLRLRQVEQAATTAYLRLESIEP